MQIFDFPIEELVQAHPNLYLDHCVVMAVALMSEQSVSPCEFILQCEGFDFPELKTREAAIVRISWSELTAFKAKRLWQTEHYH